MNNVDAPSAALYDNVQREAETNMADNNIGSLEGEALKRKERLQALKRKTEDNKENKNEISAKLPKWVFVFFINISQLNLKEDDLVTFICVILTGQSFEVTNHKTKVLKAKY